jgi:large subunit ribosomal protein L22
MQFCAKARFIKYSPYKLRPLADVIRGKNAQFALNWLATHASQRTIPVAKVLKSAVHNAIQQGKCEPTELFITDLRVDQGPMFRYFKPGAMGRSTILRKRFSHIHVVVEPGKPNKKIKEVL